MNVLNSYFYLIPGAFICAFLWQVVVWIGETSDKKRKYRNAEFQAKKMDKPLLVAGGPWGAVPVRYWLKIPAHGGGDVCLDIDRRALRGHECGVVSDVKYIPFRNKSFGAVFASHLLEHLNTVEDAVMALGELERTSDTIFIVSPSRQSIPAMIRYGHHLWIWQKGNTIFLKQRGIKAKNNPVVRYSLPNR